LAKETRMATDGAKTYFMTGAAGGIGGWVSDRLIERGDRVFATDVNIDALRERANQGRWPEDRVRVAPLDVRKSEDWEDRVQRRDERVRHDRRAHEHRRRALARFSRKTSPTTNSICRST
jgi:NADP-dependent 3-hydroxy acid dehydrogenase YdfG